MSLFWQIESIQLLQDAPPLPSEEPLPPLPLEEDRPPLPPDDPSAPPLPESQPAGEARLAAAGLFEPFSQPAPSQPGSTPPPLPPAGTAYFPHMPVP